MKLKLTICGLVILLIIVITVSYYTNKEGFANEAEVKTFNESQQWTAPSGVTKIEVLVVAGGGGGGAGGNRAGGGGGGGGVIYNESYNVTPNTEYSISVGAGGTGGAGGNNYTPGISGGNSTFGTLTASGGGGGGDSSKGLPGGSGGGGSQKEDGGGGTENQGFAGANGAINN